MSRTEAPYLRIVNDIRARIGSGELRPGDLVPSARQITRDWGVAIATATKVLATLRQDGLARAVPGIGTVVTSDQAAPTAGGQAIATRRPAGTRAANEPELTRRRVVRAAIAVALAEGLAAVSMRRVAADLGVATMSLYRHVGSKDELLTYMIDEAIGEESLPATPPEGWRARMEYSTRLQWRGFRTHPWLARAMSMTRPQLAPNALRHTEWALEALQGLNLGPDDKLHIHLLLFNFGRGLAINTEPEVEAQQDTGMTNDEWMETQEDALKALATSGAFDNFMNMVMTAEFKLDLDSLFEFGLPRLLDGLEIFIASRKAQAPTVPRGSQP